jgi:hypothetical protein
MLLAFAAFLRWMLGLSVLVILVVVALVLRMNHEAFHQIYVIYNMYRDTRNAAVGKDAGSKAIYQATETHRVTRPMEKLCWILFGVEIFTLLIFPLWMLFDIGNQAIAMLFIILGFFSACHHYFSVPVVLSELGSLDLLDGAFICNRSVEADTNVNDDKDWHEKNHLSKIVARISQGGHHDVWIRVITAFVMIFLLLFLYAFTGGSNSGSASDKSNLLSDFCYVPNNGTFKYTLCSMTADFSIPGSNLSAMANYAFMAGIAYSSPESMPDLLDAWFREGVAYDDVEKIEQFKTKYKTESAVHYKLIAFASNPDFAVMAIRGPTMDGTC